LRVQILIIDGKSTWSEGDIEVLPEGLKVKPPASMAKKIVISAIIGPAFSLSAKGKAFIIPYERIKNIKLVNVAKRGEVSGLELNFIDENNNLHSFTFAVAGIIGFDNEKTKKLYEQILSKLKIS